METIDDDTDKHGIQFVKSNDVKLAHEIGIFAFPALVYYETGVPIMYDGKFSNANTKENSFSKKELDGFSILIYTLVTYKNCMLE